MEKLERWKTAFTFTFASLIMGISYEFRLGETLWPNIIIPNTVVAILLFSTSGIIANLTAAKLMRSSRVRMFIMSGQHVEGYWFLKTTPANNNDQSPLLLPGIARMKYDLRGHMFTVTTTRFDGNERFDTCSDVAYIGTKDTRVKYLNFFSLTHKVGEDGRPKQGFSSGTFSHSDDLRKKPVTFTASISIENDAVTRIQKAIKIPETIVKEYIRDYGADWMKTYIDEQTNDESI